MVPQVDAQKTESPNKVAKIAIVENEVSSRKEWTKVLNPWSTYRVTGEFGSGEEALERILETPPHFVLMDIDLPGCLGSNAHGS